MPTAYQIAQGDLGRSEVDGGLNFLPHGETISGFELEKLSEHRNFTGNVLRVPIKAFIREQIQESVAVKEALGRESAEVIARIAKVILEGLRAGNKVLLFGNGGSAADAQHIAAELVGRYEANRKALPAIALTTDTSVLTAVGNDYGFEEIFARQISALGKPGDVALAISTSGGSPNVLKGLEAAKTAGMLTIGFSGRKGGKMKALVDYCLCVPSDTTARIQEAHILVGHIISSVVERAFLVA